MCLKGDNPEYTPRKGGYTYEHAIDQAKGYFKDASAKAEYWCVLYFSIGEFESLPKNQVDIARKINFRGWNKSEKDGLLFRCNFIINPPKDSKCSINEKYYPICYLWGTIGNRE